jgi:hypothetical protein
MKKTLSQAFTVHGENQHLITPQRLSAMRDNAASDRANETAEEREQVCFADDTHHTHKHMQKHTKFFS